MSNMYWLVPLLYYPAWQFDILGQIIWFCLKSINFLHSSRAYNWDSFNFYSFRLTEMNCLRRKLTSGTAKWFGPKIIHHHSFISKIRVLPKTFTSIRYIILWWLVIWGDPQTCWNFENVSTCKARLYIPICVMVIDIHIGTYRHVVK